MSGLSALLADAKVIHWYQLLLIGVLVGTQGTWLFLAARRRGRTPWFWGLWGLTTFPLPALLYYWLVVRPERPRS